MSTLIGKRIFFVVILLLMTSDIAAAAVTARELLLDIEWGRGKAAQWDGQLDVIKGDLLNVDRYLLDKGEQVTQISEHTAKWNSTTSGLTDGIRITIAARPDTELVFSSPVGKRSIRVSDIVRDSKKWNLDKHGHVLSIHRHSASVVSISSARETYIFNTGEQWTPLWTINLGFRHNNPLVNYTIELFRDGNNSPLWVSEKKTIQFADGLIGKINDLLKMPRDEGVYTVKVRFSASDIYLPDSVIQVIVLDPQKQPEMLTEGMEMPKLLVDSVNPIVNTDSQRFRDDGKSSVVNRGGIQYRVSGRYAQRASKKQDSERTMSWFAYRLHVQNPNKPHILEIDYPNDQRRRFLVSILEQKPAGRSRNSVDLGIVSEGATNNEAQLRTKRIVFWPTTIHPAIAFVNTLKGSNAAIHSLRLYELPQGLAINGNNLYPNDAPALRGPYFEEAQFQHILGGAESPDHGMEYAGITRPDWKSYYDAVNHLCQLVRYRGENAVMSVVYAYGATLYPSDQIKNNGRYDDGMDFRDGRDPIQKDVVRLTLRLFERYDITFVPTFSFYSRIDSLEEAYSPDSKGRREIDLINSAGQSARHSLKLKSGGVAAPFYNPLHSAVQKQVRLVLTEFVSRYNDSRALGDIAIQLNTTGWLQFPGLDWGYDPPTVEAFFQDKHIDFHQNLVSEYEAHQQRYIFLNTEPMKSSWIQWRNLKLRNFYASVADDVHRLSAGKKKLVLSYMNTFTSSYTKYNATKKIAAGTAPRALLAVKGVDPAVLGDIPGVRVWRPLRTPIPFSNPSEIRAEASRHPSTTKLFKRAGADGIVQFFDYFETRLYSLEKNWWWPLNYWTVATIRNAGEPYPLDEGIKATFYGGWQFPQ